MSIKELAEAADALWKLMQYGYLPARQVFYLAQRRESLFDEINAYCTARNSLLAKYGTSEDGTRYTVNGKENIAAYNRELAELEQEPVATDFDTGRVSLCVETIEKTDEKLPPERRLGFTADDWENIQLVLPVTECEE